MAFLEEKGDEALCDEVLLAAVDAAVARRLGGIHQQSQQQRQHRQFLHPAPALSSAAPHKKLAIVPVPSAAPPAPAQHVQYVAGVKKEVAVVAKCPQMSSMDNLHNSRGAQQDAIVSSGARDSKQLGFVRNVAAGTCNRSGPGSPDVNGYGNTGGVAFFGRGGRVGEVKQEANPVNCNLGAVARRPLQELQPWVGARQRVEKPSSPSCLQVEQTSCSSNDNTVAWFSGLSGVAMFKECQEAAMRTLVPSDYTMMSGKPFIKKTGWRKIAFFFNISFEIKDKDIKFDQQANVLRAEFVVRASMPSGRFTDSWGSCDRGEKRFSKPNHDIPSTAETRAKTRACQDLLGIGEYKSDGWQ